MNPEGLYLCLPLRHSCSQNAEDAFKFYFRKYSSDFGRNSVKLANL